MAEGGAGRKGDGTLPDTQSVVAPAKAGAHQSKPLDAAAASTRIATGVLGGSKQMGGWVHIMTNGPHGTLYIGVTADLPARITQHREGRGSEFCRKHGLIRLVYAEPHNEIMLAITREKQMKKWKRQWKIKLIRQSNPDWRDLYDELIYLT